MKDAAMRKPKCVNRRLGILIGLYEFGALTETMRHRFLEHLMECDSCYLQVYALEPVMTAFRDHRAAAQARGVDPHMSIPVMKRRNSARLIPAFALLLVAVAAGWGVYSVIKHRGNGSNGQTGQGSTTNESALIAALKNIDIPKPAYHEPDPRVRLRGSDEVFARAMAAYQADDYPVAIDLLQTLSDLEPTLGTNASFYLGVSLLRVGRTDEALPSLRRALRSSDAVRAESIHYYLALGYLREDEQQHAITELDAVIQMKGDYYDSALNIKNQIVDRAK